MLRHPLLTAPVVSLAVCAGCLGEPAVDDKEPLPFAAASADAAPDPKDAGPYPVGVRTFALDDDLRLEEQADGTLLPRHLPLEVWYPAKESARDDESETMRLFDALPLDLRVGLTPEDLGAVATIAVRDAPARADGERYPLVVFSHGKGGIRLQSNFYTAYLASHGYVVVAPDHTGDTIVELLREVKETGDIQADSTLEALANRPEDVIAVLDLLDDVLRADDGADIADVVDLDRVGLTGHSFGALTSFIVATKDFRIDAVVGQTPTSQDVVELQQDTPLTDVRIPMVVQSATLDNTLPEATNAAPLYRTLQTEKAWLSLARAGHFTYSDLCVLDVDAINAAIELDVSNVLDDGCGSDAIPPALAEPVIRRSAIGAFNLYLRGSTDSRTFLTQAALDEVAPGEGTLESAPAVD
jgi:predicted dienelactone hydrolase